MQRDDDQIARFVCRLIAWLPLCFALWYLFAGPLLLPVVMFLDGTIRVLAPQILSGVSLDGHLIVVDTHLTARSEGGRSGSLIFELNPLVFTWNLPVLAGLQLAGFDDGKLAKRLLYGYALLVPAWIWGVSSQIGKTLAFDLGSDITEQLGQPGLWLDLLALAYQFGILILPGLAVVVVWLAIDRDALTSLVALNSNLPTDRIIDTASQALHRTEICSRQRPRRRALRKKR